MPTFLEGNGLEFARIGSIANSLNDCPVFMIKLNKYFDRDDFLNRNEKYGRFGIHRK